MVLSLAFERRRAVEEGREGETEGLPGTHFGQGNGYSMGRQNDAIIDAVSRVPLVPMRCETPARSILL